jgi:hypothetical protein
MLDDDASKRLKELVEEQAPPFMPSWAYILVFTLPALLTLFILIEVIQFDLVLSFVIALAVMNGSINSIIAILTIRLDGHSQEALDHLDAIMGEMERFEDTLDQANSMVTSFTGDLDEAKVLFTKVGINLNELDLEPVAEVVEKLKENKDGLTEVLDNLREVNVSEYIAQAKGIDWKGLLDAAEEVMGFIKSKSSLTDIRTIPAAKLPFSLNEEEEEFFDEGPLVQYKEPVVIEPRLTLSPPPRKSRLDLTPPPRK